MASVEKVTAKALGRVLARHVTARRPIEYPDLLVETAAELERLEERLRRDARTARRASKQVCEVLLQVAEYSAFYAGPGVPAWHPEHDSNDVI